MAYDEQQEWYSFFPDVLVPSEYEDALVRRTYREPEVKLMAAVLDDAIGCFERYATRKNPKAVRIFSETEEWFFGEQQDWLFSFENVCGALGLEPGYFRKGLINLKARLLSQRNPHRGNGTRKAGKQGSRRPRVIRSTSGSSVHANLYSSKHWSSHGELRKKLKMRT